MLLALPGLVLPGGLDIEVCLCRDFEAVRDVGACCATSCCEDEAPQGPVAEDACARCGDCCLTIELERREPATASEGGTAQTLALIPAAACVGEAPAPEVVVARCDFARALAPPLATRALPLRI